MAAEGALGRRILAIVFIVAVFAAAVVVFFKYAKPSFSPPGSSDVDQLWLLCAKCDGEFSVTSTQLNELPRDPSTGAYKCLKCGALQAQLASMRCPHCGRLVVRQAFGTAYVCPHCKKSLATGPIPGQAADAKAPNAPGGSGKP